MKESIINLGSVNANLIRKIIISKATEKEGTKKDINQYADSKISAINEYKRIFHL